MCSLHNHIIQGGKKMEISELINKYGAVNEDNNLTNEEIKEIMKNSEVITRKGNLWEKQ